MSLTPQDLKSIHEVVETVLNDGIDPIKKDIKDLKHSVGSLTTSVDSLLHIVRRHEGEWLVLRAQHSKIRDLLVAKGIATEDELAVA